MKLHEAISQQLIPHSTSLPAKVISACNLCRSLEDCGDYAGAWELLAELLPAADLHSLPSDLDDVSRAELMLRRGVLTGWLGCLNQAEGSQEQAKDLISGSIEIFRAVGSRSGEAEGYVCLAACYHRQSLLDNARACVQTAMGLIDVLGEQDLKARALIRLAFVERDAGRLQEALRIHREARPVVEAGANDALRGMFYTEYALVLRRVAASDGKPELYDEALIQYAAASHHYERAGNLRYQAAVENNLGFLLMRLTRYASAHEHIDGALDIAARLKDKEFVAQVLDTRAQIFVEQKQYKEAVQSARRSVELLKKGEQRALLVASLTTLGIALSKVGDKFRSLTSLEKAVDLASEVDDYAGAVRAAVALINEIETLSPERQASVYQRALEQAGRVQDAELFNKLSECAGSVLNRRSTTGVAEIGPSLPTGWEGFSHKQWMARAEERLIRKALLDADGSVRKASRLLGLNSHQALFALLKRHPGLRALHHTKTEPTFAGRKGALPRGCDMKRIAIRHNWLSGLGIYAGSVVMAFLVEVREGELVAVTTRQGSNAVGGYKLVDKKIILEVFSMEYEAFEFERGEVAEVRKVYAWYPEGDEADVHLI